MPLSLGVADTLEEALKELKRQGLDIGPHIKGIMADADELAELSARAITLDLAKRAVSLAQSGGVYSVQDAVRKAFEAQAKQVAGAFDTNLRTAYSAARFERASKDRDASLFILRTMGDRRVRPAHARLDGTTLAKGDEFWAAHWPPMGHRCRCKAYAITLAGAMRLKQAGKEVQFEAPAEKTATYTNKLTGETETVPVSVGPGWLINGEAPARNPVAAMRYVVARKEAELQSIYTGKPVAVVRPPAAPAKPSQPELPLVPDTKDWTHEDYIKAGNEITSTLIGESVRDFAHGKEMNAKLVAHLQETVSTTGTAIVAKVSGVDVEADLKHIGALLPDTWKAKANAFGRLSVKQKNARGGYFQYLGELTYEKGELTTLLHEYTHRMQHAMPELDAMFKALHEKRTAGEKLRSMPGYAQKEKSRWDHYIDKYFGKHYPQPTGALADPDDKHWGALEVMTMSMQSVLGNSASGNGFDQIAFKKLYNEDRELFDLVVGLLFKWKP